jgi:diguanylate cyclase (GGDEF)-like protein
MRSTVAVLGRLRRGPVTRDQWRGRVTAVVATNHELTPTAVERMLLQATRRLLTTTSSTDARALARELVTKMGGTTVLASESVFCLPVDISFGVGPTEFAWAPPGSAGMILLEAHLPRFVADANEVLAKARQTERFAEDANVDVLTGLANRRSLDRFLRRLQAGEVLVMLDLDSFKRINDTKGHHVGDAILSALGRTLLSQVRARDRVGRYGGDEFLLVLSEGSNPHQLLERLRTEWETARPHGVTFSAGIAPVVDEPESTLSAADHAMYRAKAAGGDRWIWATRDEYPDARRGRVDSA